MKIEPFASINKVNKGLYGTDDPVVMLKRYKRCITFDKKSGCFLLKTTTPLKDRALDKLFKYIEFMIHKCPELKMVRKTNPVIKKSGKVYVASCIIDITLW